MSFERFQQLFYRIKGTFEAEPLTVIIELLVIWLGIFAVMTFLQGSRGARALKGVLMLFVIGTLFIRVIIPEDSFERLNYIYTGVFNFSAIALVILFAPEIRRGLVRLGEWTVGTTGLRKQLLIEEVIASVQYLSKNKVGALIAVEREVGLRGITEAGISLDCIVSRQVLDTIFWPGSALHDMGVVIRGDRIVSAGVQFPLADGEQISSELGSRHRAAIGLSQEADALILVVSEETGTISVAERGTLTRQLNAESLRGLLIKGLGQTKFEKADERREDEEAKRKAGVETSDEPGVAKPAKTGKTSKPA